ncbi:MAG: porin [Bacteroidetes bacterium]|nr:porin [Bacteroidota bacterium]MBS1930254.1 porin [Bacteroidota bacterium]
MLRKFYLLSWVLLLAVTCWSQTASLSPTFVNTSSKPEDIFLKDSSPALIFNGSVDMYYKNDFAKTKLNSYTSFTNTQNMFSMGMVSFKISRNSRNVSAVADLGFGKRASDFSYTDNGILAAIKQLYISYSPATWIKLTAGTWATHIGFEVLDPQLNRNYSMSYMFTNGPFSHTGLKMEVSKGNHGLMIGVSNATDFRMSPDNQINKKFLIAQYSYAPNDKIKVYLNYVSGQNPDTSKTRQIDLVFTSKISEKFTVAYNGTINKTKLWDGFKNIASKNWWGSAIYMNYDPVHWLGLTIREEYFSDKNHLKLPVNASGASILASTFSANFKVDGFIFISEIRVDHSSKQIFLNSEGNGSRSAANLLFAAIYFF